MPLASEIDALEMRPALGYGMLVEPVDGGADFRDRLYGSNLAAVSGFDMTGNDEPCGEPVRHRVCAGR